jgi:hypothetical protein
MFYLFCTPDEPIKSITGLIHFKGEKDISQYFFNQPTAGWAKINVRSSLLLGNRATRCIKVIGKKLFCSLPDSHKINDLQVPTDNHLILHSNITRLFFTN